MIHKRLTHVTLLALAILGCASAALAQPSRDSSVARALAEFDEGDRIRVALLRSPFVGRYVSTRGDTLFFGTPGQPPMAFRFNAVDSLWRHDRATSRGAWIGAVAGVASGFVAYAATADGDRRGAGNALAIAAIGTVGGAGLGAVIGTGFRRWRLVYGNPEPRGFDLHPPPSETMVSPQ
ncbi:MAG: hypothetical protein ACREOK_08615 [Gemmatimonadaceae bacterium]